MTILEKEPGVRVQCPQCNSVYLIYPEDIVSRQDILLGQPNDCAPDRVACWDCPVCGHQQGHWLFKLPGKWRKQIRREEDSTPFGFKKELL